MTQNELYRLKCQLGKLGNEAWGLSKGNARLSVCKAENGIRPAVAHCSNSLVAEHIATFDPATCLRLLAEIEALQAGQQLPEAA